MRRMPGISLVALAVCCCLTGWPVLTEAAEDQVAAPKPAKTEEAVKADHVSSSEGKGPQTTLDVSSKIQQSEALIRKIDQGVPEMLKVSGWPTLTGYFQDGRLAKAIMDGDTYWYNDQGDCFAFTSEDDSPGQDQGAPIRYRHFQDDVDSAFAMGREDTGYRMEASTESPFEHGDAYPPGTAKSRLDYLLSLSPKGEALPTTWTMKDPLTLAETILSAINKRDYEAIRKRVSLFSGEMIHPEIPIGVQATPEEVVEEIRNSLGTGSIEWTNRWECELQMKEGATAIDMLTYGWKDPADPYGRFTLRLVATGTWEWDLFSRMYDGCAEHDSAHLWRQEVIAPSGLTVRETPAKDGKKVTTLPKGTSVYVLETSTVPPFEIEGRKGTWVRVFNPKTGQGGWAFAGFLQQAEKRTNRARQP